MRQCKGEWAVARAVAAMAACGAASMLGGCDRPPPSDQAREWTASDHDRSDEKEKMAVGAQASAAPRGSGAPRDDSRALGDLAWRQQCATCHGMGGRGDGPQGPIFKAADLSAAEWQGKVSDAEIAAVIVNGKGKMPKFELPEAVVRGLVSRVRSFRR